MKFYMQTYAVGLTGLSDKIKTFVTTMSDIVTESVPNGQFGAYAGYVE